MSNDLKYVKFEMLIDDVNKGLNKSIFNSVYSELCNALSVYGKNDNKKNPLELIVDKKNINEYGKIILSKVDFTIEEWTYEYSHKDLSNQEVKVVAIKDLVRKLRESKQQSLELMFWSLFIISVDKKDCEERILMISDLANMININNDMIKDLIELIKYVLGQRIGYGYKTNEVKAMANLLSGIN